MPRAEQRVERRLNEAELKAIREIYEMVKQIHEMTKTNDHTLAVLVTNSNRIVTLLEEKFDRLIDVVAGKNMVPVPVFGWLVAFLLLYTFAIRFGPEHLSGISKIFGF